MKPQLFSRVLIPYGILGVSLVIAFLPLLAGQQFFYSYDLLYQNYIWRDFAQWSLHHGSLPLTFYGEGCGNPLLAEGQIGFFYPINLLLYWLVDTWTGLQISIVIHTIWSLLGSYLLARYLQTSRLIASLIACSYAYSGYMSIHLTQINLHAAASWLPWMLYFATKVIKRKPKSTLDSICLGISCSLPFLAGHPQIGLYSVLCVLIWIWLLTQNLNIRIKTTLVVLLGVLIAGIQLVPSYLFFQQSNRAGQNILDALSYSANPLLLIRGYLFLPPPEVFNTWTVFQLKDINPSAAIENYQTLGLMFGPLYIGLALMILFSFLKQKGNQLQRKLVLLSIFWLLVTLGKWGGIHWVLSMLPGFSGMRAPARAGFVLALMISLTVGLWLPKILPKEPFFKRLLLIITAIICFIIIPIQIPLLNPTEHTDLARAQIELLKFNYQTIQNPQPPIIRYDWQPTQLYPGELPRVPSERIRTDIKVNSKNEIQPTIYTAGPVRWKKLEQLLQRLNNTSDKETQKSIREELNQLDFHYDWTVPLIIGSLLSIIGFCGLIVVSRI